jgi:hypothetical protein
MCFYHDFQFLIIKYSNRYKKVVIFLLPAVTYSQTAVVSLTASFLSLFSFSHLVDVAAITQFQLIILLTTALMLLITAFMLLLTALLLLTTALMLLLTALLLLITALMLLTMAFMLLLTALLLLITALLPQLRDTKAQITTAMCVKS